MTDVPVTLRPALGGKQPVVLKDIRIEALPEGHVVQILARPNEGDLYAFIETTANTAPFAVRWTAPGQWFLVGDATWSHAAMLALFSELRPRAEAVDQSQGRVRIGIRGAMAARILAKGTAVDLDIAQFPVGSATTTLVGHIAAHITRTDTDAFEVMVLRGFAESLWDELVHMSLEFS